MEITADALNAYQNVLPAGFFNKISGILGIPVEKTKEALGTAIPAIFRAVQQRAVTPDGAKNVMAAIHNSGFDQPVSVSADATVVDSQLNKGQMLLTQVLGGRTDAIAGKVASSAGVSAPVASKLLGAASAAVFSFIGSKMRNGNLSASSFSTILGQGAGTMPDLSRVRAAGLEARKVWPWVLGAIVIALGLVWLLSRTTPSNANIGGPVVETATVESAVVTPAAIPSDADIIDEMGRTLANETATLPQTFSLRELTFATGSAAMASDAQSTVDRLSQTLTEFPAARIRINGHTDNIGNATFNEQLSYSRAETLRNALIARGIAPDRIEVMGSGANNPVADNSTEAGRQANRRTDIQVLNR